MKDSIEKVSAILIAIIISLGAYKVGSESGYEDGFRDCAEIAEFHVSESYRELSWDCRDIIIGFEKDDYTDDEFAKLMAIIEDLRHSIYSLDASEIKKICLDELEDLQ